MAMQKKAETCKRAKAAHKPKAEKVDPDKVLIDRSIIQGNILYFMAISKWTNHCLLTAGNRNHPAIRLARVFHKDSSERLIDLENACGKQVDFGALRRQI